MVTDPLDRFVETPTLRMCYRDEGDPSQEPVLMIMGLMSQLIHWPQEIVDALVAAGYRVIRFDNRDSGLTTWRGEAPDGYRLADMADDAVALLDHLAIEQANVVGASMGGMISQRLAIDHPERVRTLCSIMSTTGNALVGWAKPGVIDELIKPMPEDRDQAIAQIVSNYELIGSTTYAAEERPGRENLAATSYDRALGDDGKPLHPEGGRRQVGAILNGGDRTMKLRTLTVDTLVIHGNEDSLIHISGGRATRDVITNSTWLAHPADNGDDGVDGMGHDLPTPLHDAIANAIVANITRQAAVG